MNNKWFDDALLVARDPSWQKFEDVSTKENAINSIRKYFEEYVVGYKVTDFYHPGDEGGLAWNDPDIGIEWPELVGEYNGTASAQGYTLKDGTPLNLSDKDQKWSGLKETFRF